MRQGHVTCSGQYILFAGANLCLLFLASRHSHVYHVRGSSYHVARPGDRRAHPTHTRSDRIVPVAKIQGKARMVRHVGRRANAMGSSGMSGWEAHVLLALTMWWWLG